MLKVKAQDQEGIKAALTAECVADVRTDGTEATIIVSAATICELSRCVGQCSPAQC